MKEKGWFVDWFDTEYYHMLYCKRDDEEAAKFIRTLMDRMQLERGSKIADIACGKGRHSRVLAGLGYLVTGYDLSENSIKYARKHASGSEVFEVQDMRLPFPQNDFKAALNLFTSFGYFETLEEDMDCLLNFYNLLQPGGYFIQDYINGQPVLQNLPIQAKEECNGMHFLTNKTWNDPFVVKEIQVTTPTEVKHFKEKVKIYKADDLLAMHTQCGFVTQQVFGSYQFTEYDAATSPRLIIVSQKPK